jgi:PAS domain S-box-containing protein
VAAYACDAAGRVLWFNGRAADLWGRVPRIGDDTELFCGSYKLYFGGRAIGRSETPMAHALRSGESVQGVEGVVERPDGSRVWAMVHIEPVKDDAGRVLGAINCFHDTTELHRARDRAAEAEERSRQLLEALPAAIYTTDAEGRITYYNRAAVEMSGREPALGSDQWCVTWRLYSPDGRPMPHDECPMAIALKENRAIRNVEAVAERPDGALVPFLPYPTPLRDRAGKLVGAVNMLIDISERKDAESRQRVLLRELNHRVKNNMQMLQSLLSSAQRETTSPEARLVLADACRRVAAMAAAQQILYEEGAPTSFSAKDFLDSVCLASKSAFATEVNITVDAATGALSNDAAMPLALILNELLTNAVKHAVGGDAGGAIRVGLVQEGDGHRLFVEDDGPGFEFDAAVRKRASGLGLVNGLARQLGGTFRVERAPGARCIVEFQERRTALQ